MNSNSLPEAPRQASEASLAQTLESLLIKGDLAKLSPQERVKYYLKVCDTAGLNPYTQPFEYITFDGKTVLYARKAATDQLRTLRNISIVRTESKIENDIYTVTAYAKDLTTGREDSDVGSVCLTNLKGAQVSNAVMKAHTKAKRRVTLSICGLSILDESETDDIVGAQKIELETPAREAIPTESPDVVRDVIDALLVQIGDKIVTDAIVPYVIRAGENVKELNVIKSKLEKKLREKRDGSL